MKVRDPELVCVCSAQPQCAFSACRFEIQSNFPGPPAGFGFPSLRRKGPRSDWFEIINMRRRTHQPTRQKHTNFNFSLLAMRWSRGGAPGAHPSKIPKASIIFQRSLVISPPPVKPEGTIGLHSVCLSVCLSVRPSVRHTSFRTITDSVIHLWSWNFIHLLPMSQGCALLILGSKGQRSRSWRMVIWKWFPDDNWLCNQPMIMKLHTLTQNESRMRPIDFESKGQRSRSWRMVIWKWFPDDNSLCNQPMIMKLHTLTHHESRMCPIDFQVKRSKVKVMAHGYLKMVSGR